MATLSQETQCAMIIMYNEIPFQTLIVGAAAAIVVYTLENSSHRIQSQTFFKSFNGLFIGVGRAENKHAERT